MVIIKSEWNYTLSALSEHFKQVEHFTFIIIKLKTVVFNSLWLDNFKLVASISFIEGSALTFINYYLLISNCEDKERLASFLHQIHLHNKGNIQYHINIHCNIQAHKLRILISMQWKQKVIQTLIMQPSNQ